MTKARAKVIEAMAKARADLSAATHDPQLHGLAVKLNRGKGTSQDRAQFDALVERPPAVSPDMPLFLANEEELWCLRYHEMKLSSDAGMRAVASLRATQARLVRALGFWAGHAVEDARLAGSLDDADAELLALLMTTTGRTEMGARKTMPQREIASILGVGLATARRRIDAFRSKHAKLATFLDDQTPRRRKTGAAQKAKT